MSESTFHSKGNLSPSSKRTILVVDDDKFVCELCALALQEYRVIQAGSCDEALKLYECEHVDLVLSDIMMPGGSGIELLKRVKALDPNTTVVIMTGFVGKDIILKALKEDADDFISKPLNLLQLKASIEKTLGRKALKEELANIRLADEIKNTFLSLVSHKLRTPITGISLFLQNLKEGVIDPNDPVFEQNVAMADEEAHYMGQLVADLLLFSQVMINGSSVSKSPCDLNELVAQVLLKCQEVHCHFDAEIDVTLDSLPLVPLDASKISFALLQVVDNAFKFSGKLGYIAISLECRGDNVFIIVSDSGIGIPKSEIPKVFEKFYQIDPDHTGQVRGFGLGLFYAREFILQHGGSIDLASEPGLGTTVTISLPLQ